MLIVGQGIAVPTQKVTNSEVVDRVRFHSREHFSQEELTCILETIGDTLDRTGIRTRSWLGETDNAAELVSDAFDRAIATAGIAARDIDVVIYCSIHRGFLEPATASILCDALGIRPKRAFDVLDACMGWATALEVANHYLAEGQFGSVAVVSTEFGNRSDGAIYPTCFAIKDRAELSTKLAGMTIGEAAAVTIVSDGDGSQWEMLRIESPQHAALCNVPVHHSQRHQSEQPSDHSPGTFFADSSRLAACGFRPSLSLLKDYVNRFGEPDVIIPHSVSDMLTHRTAVKADMQDKVFSTFSEYGNLATASLPVSLAVGVGRGRIRRDHHVMGWVASAGMKFCAFPIRLCARAIEKTEGC